MGPDRIALAPGESSLARMEFAAHKYEQALPLYLKVPKDHPMWVQALIEQGWTQLAVDDFSGAGVVASFDPTIASNSLRQVIGTNNYPTNDPNPYLSGLCVTGMDTNMEIWMTDANCGAFPNSCMPSW